MGRRSISGGVTPLGAHRIQFDFAIEGVRYRPTVSWIPHETNLRRAFDFGFQDHPEHHNPARALQSARINKKDRPKIDPFSIQDAETLKPSSLPSIATGAKRRATMMRAYDPPNKSRSS